MNRFIWVFVLLAALFDAAFAYKYRNFFLEWEVNPIACWLAIHCGFFSVLFLKTIGLALSAYLVFVCKRHLTAFVGSAYAILMAHYAIRIALP